MRALYISLLLAGSLSAAQVAVLFDGTRITVKSHENNGPMILLYTDQGPREVAAEAIYRFFEAPVLDPPPLLSVPPPVLPVADKPAPKPVDHNELIRLAARKHRVPMAIMRSIVAAESGFNPNAVSPYGALGLMQVMPQTAEQYGLDASVPEQNVDAGARYLRSLLDKYQKYSDSLRRAIAAYNAGPTAVDKYQGVPPYPETQTYVARVLALVEQFRR